MAEQLDLANPVTSCKVTELFMRFRGQESVIEIRVEGDPASVFKHTYLGAEAESMLRTLNTANLTTKSLHRRILEKLTADGIIQGTVSGIPDA